MKASDLYQSPYLKAADVTKPVKLTISELTIGTFTDQKTQKDEKRIVLSFAGAKKQLILNKTGAGNLAAAFGDELEGWPGKEVILSPGVANNGAQMVLVQAAPSAREESDDIPF
jgi:hypothetical protein